MSTLKIAAIDYENYYDKELSITTMGGVNYTRHPKTRPYMVSVAASTGHSYVGAVDDFDFAAISGPDWLWVHHNASYDPLVYARLHDENPEAFPLPANDPQCTADLSAFLGFPRSLAGAVYAAYGQVLSKSVRDNMKGRMPEDLSPAERDDLARYALDDAKWCLKLWMDFSDRWPENERRASLMTRQMGWEGLLLDSAKIEEDKKKLAAQIWEAKNQIPWSKEAAALSPKQLALACREVGITPPPSLALDSEECAEWEDLYGDQFPWVDAMRRVRRCNAMLKKLEAMEARVKPDGRMNYDLKYVGAHTKRWSGGGGVNVQNLTSKEMFGVDIRSELIAPEGKVFIMSDLAQIEPRCSALVSRDWEFLDSLASGISPYIIHARQTMGLGPDEVWPKNDLRYKLAKARVLALGYGAGHRKFLWMATNLYGVGEIFDQPLLDGEYNSYARYASEVDAQWYAEWKALPENIQHRYVVAKRIVDDFRAKSPLLASNDPQNPGMWKQLGDALRQSALSKEDLELQLPSGNVLRYKNVRFRGKEMCVQIVKNGTVVEVRTYGANLYENLIQSIARDAFRDCLINVADAGYKIVLHVHDEIVVEVDEADAEHHRKEMERLMGVSPKWAPRLPVDAEASISKFYKK